MTSGKLPNLCRLSTKAQWTLQRVEPLWKEREPSEGAGVRGGTVPWKAQRGAWGHPKFMTEQGLYYRFSDSQFGAHATVLHAGSWGLLDGNGRDRWVLA